MAGAFDNIAGAARERRRREQMALENPGMGLSLVSQSPEWDAFFGGLHDIQDAGMGLRMDWRGFGRDANEDTGNGGGPSVFDRESLKNQAIAQQSNAAAMQARAQNFGQDAYNDQQERERIADLYRAYAQQQQAQQQAPLIPAEDTKINVDTSRTSGNTVSSRPAGDATQQMLARMNPIDRMNAQKQIESEDIAKRAAAVNEREQSMKEAALAETIRKNRVDEGGNDVAENVKTTLSGKTYLDLGEYQTPTAREAARRRAQAQGITVVPPEVGASLAAADTAKQNINAMWAQIESKLPRDPTGRLVAGPANKLSQFFQGDSDLAAFNSWRAGAIQAVQALVEKGMGFRLNQAEINMIMQNDMPQITDTVQTARRRVDNVLTLLQNKENSALTKDRSALVSGDESDTIYAKDPQGNIHSAKKGTPLKPGWSLTQKPAGVR